MHVPTSYDRQPPLDQSGGASASALPQIVSGRQELPEQLVDVDEVTPGKLLTRMSGSLTADEVLTMTALPVPQVRAYSEMFGCLPVGPGGPLRYRHDVVAGYFPRL